MRKSSAPMSAGSGLGHRFGQRELTGLKQQGLRRRRRPLLGRSAGQIDVGQEIIEKAVRLCVEETLGRGGAIGTRDEVVMHGGQGVQPGVAEAVQTMMAESQLSIAPFGAGARALKELSALGGDLFNELFLLAIKQEKRTVLGVQRGE